MNFGTNFDENPFGRKRCCARFAFYILWWWVLKNCVWGEKAGKTAAGSATWQSAFHVTLEFLTNWNTWRARVHTIPIQTKACPFSSTLYRVFWRTRSFQVNNFRAGTNSVEKFAIEEQESPDQHYIIHNNCIPHVQTVDRTQLRRPKTIRRPRNVHL